jgi:Flp pilus assembly protein TadD
MNKDHPDILPQLLRGDVSPGQAVGLDAKQTAALMRTGHTLFTQGQWGAARDIFAGLAVLDPDNAYVHGMLGAISHQEGDWDAAIKHYSRCLELSPDDPQAWVNRGEILLRAGYLDKSAADFAEAIARDPAGQNPAANRARVLVVLVRDTLKAAQEKGVEGIQEAKRTLQAYLDSVAESAG